MSASFHALDTNFIFSMDSNAACATREQMNASVQKPIQREQMNASVQKLIENEGGQSIVLYEASQEAENEKRKRSIKSKCNKRRKKEKIVASGKNKKLIVFDLNGVLIYRQTSYEYVIRPYALDMLNYLADRCDLAIWTSAKKTTVKRLFRTLFTADSGFCQSRFKFIWCQNRCSKNKKASIIDTTISINNTKPQFWKEISLIFEEYPEYAYQGGCFILDDSLTKLERNPDHSSIHVPTYQGLGDDDVFMSGKDLHQKLTYLTEISNINTICKI